MATTVQFLPLSTSITPAFWHHLTSLKLSTLHLSEDAVSISGDYLASTSVVDRQTGNSVGIPSALHLDRDSFEQGDQDSSTGPLEPPKVGHAIPPPASSSKVTLRGTLYNFNTIEAFKQCDKAKIAQDVARSVWSQCNDDRPTSSHSTTLASLSPFVVITFADLKKYKYYYWAAVPVVVVKPAWQLVSEVSSGSNDHLDEEKEEDKIEYPQGGVRLGRRVRRRRSSRIGALEPEERTQDDRIELETAPLGDISEFWKDVPSNSRTLIYTDPSNHPTAPGWTLRNVLTYVSKRAPRPVRPRRSNVASSGRRQQRVAGHEHEQGQGEGQEQDLVETEKKEDDDDDDDHEGQELSVICLREGGKRLELVMRLPKRGNGEGGGGPGGGTSSSSRSDEPMPSVVGWEKNDKGKLGPRVADLGPLMDPLRLADQAVDLNLQLMRWRILPALDLDTVKRTRCLVLGAGTLGCYVSRCLMAWGIRQITLVDNSTVSFSNPVRQPLFEFDDSLNGGKDKAECAAEALRRIYPGVNATGHKLSIPMPGHPIPGATLESVERDYRRLERLMDEHDVVFLGMDSRESRWLPTVMAGAKGKLVMNVALGFDTFLVMRHGLSTSSSDVDAGFDGETERDKPSLGNNVYKGKLGCYYCNDIVAPMDSLSDRTLDQMCTVTRPGLAAIASATAVELMVSVLQHPLGPQAPSDVPLPTHSAAAASSSSQRRPSSEADGSLPAASSCLGEVPHQIRGFLSAFNNLKITGQAYDRCTGCSEAILNEYRASGFDLVRSACEDAKHLERITGLDKLEEETEKMLQDGVDWEEEDDDDF